MFDLPVTLISGYLGSGKTSYINRQLQCNSGTRYAVLVNDFGELNIDVQLIESTSAHSVSLANGCVCCSLSGDIAAALEEVASCGHRLDWVLFEASGVADPQRVRAQVLNWPGFQLHDTLTLADATRIKALITDKFVGQHIRKQLIEAEHLTFSKTDLVDADQLVALEQWLAQLRGGAGKPTQWDPHPQFYSQTLIDEQPWPRDQLEGRLATLEPLLLRLKGFVYLQEDPDYQYLLQWLQGHWSLERFGPALQPVVNTLVAIAQQPLTKNILHR